MGWIKFDHIMHMVNVEMFLSETAWNLLKTLTFRWSMFKNFTASWNAPKIILKTTFNIL